MTRSHSARRAPSRRGLVLVPVLVCLTVLGAVTAGLFVTALRSQRSATSTSGRVHAFGAAEEGAYGVLASDFWHGDWNTVHAPALLVSDSAASLPAVSRRVRVWKLTPWSYLATSEAFYSLGPSSARARVGLLLAVRSPVLSRDAAVTATTGLTVREQSTVSGTDTSLPASDCLPADTGIAAAALPVGAPVDTSACPPTGCLTGSPPILSTQRASDPTTYEHFGQVDRSFLVASARTLSNGTSLTPQPTLTTSGECDDSATGNFGDPLRVFGPESPCASRFVLRHANGDLHIVGGAGQGLLLVDGDLTLANGALFSGVAIVRGAVQLEGESQFIGLVLAGHVTVGGHSAIRYASCAVTRSLAVGARPTPAPGQSWAEFY